MIGAGQMLSRYGMRILTHKMLRAFLWCIITVFFIAAVNALGKVVGFWDDCETAVVRLPVELTEVITNPFWEETLLEFASASEKWEVVRQATHYEISRKGSGKLWADKEQDKCCHVVVNVFDEPRQRVSKTNWNEFREMTIPVQRFREVPSAAILSSWEVCCSFPVVSWESELCIPIGVRSEVVCRERSNCPERCLTEPALEEVLIFLRLEPRDRLLTKNKEEKVDSP